MHLEGQNFPHSEDEEEEDEEAQCVGMRVPPGGLPTCVAPHRQVLVLLDVQHDLQAVARPSLHGGAQRLALLGRVEHVALAVPGEHLRGETVRRGALGQG